MVGPRAKPESIMIQTTLLHCGIAEAVTRCKHAKRRSDKQMGREDVFSAVR
jgi:hypothetical protein